MPCTTRSSSAPACRAWRPASAWPISTSGSASWSGTRTIGGLNSFYRLGGRNYDVGLHAVTNYAPKGTRKRPAGPAAAATAVRLGRFRAGAAGRLGDRVSRRRRCDSPTTSSCFESEVRRHFPAPEGQLSAAGGARWSTTTSSTERGRRSSARRGRRPRSSRDPLLVEMLFCPLHVLRQRRASTTWTSASSASCSAASFWKGLARPLAGVRLILKKLVRRFKELGGELRLRAGVRADGRRATAA